MTRLFGGSLFRFRCKSSQVFVGSDDVRHPRVTCRDDGELDVRCHAATGVLLVVEMDASV